MEKRGSPPQWIIVEGWDRSGKTTLAHRLSQDLEKPYIHFGPPKASGANESWLSLRETILAHWETGAVFDRAWWSNFIYAPLARNRIEIDFSQIAWLELATADGVLIQCNISVDTLIKRMREEAVEDDFATLLEPEKAIKVFEKTILRNSRYPITRLLDYDGGRYLDLLKSLDRNLLKNDSKLYSLGNTCSPKVVIVDKPHSCIIPDYSFSLFDNLSRFKWNVSNICVLNLNYSTDLLNKFTQIISRTPETTEILKKDFPHIDVIDISEGQNLHWPIFLL